MADQGSIARGSTRAHLRITGLALLLAIVGTAPGASEAIAGIDLEARDLVAVLPWSFEVTSEPTEPGFGSGPARTIRYRFKSTTPIKKTAADGADLRAELTTYEHGDTESARAGFDDLLAGADPVTGLSYAWDRLLRRGAVVYHLHAECSFSEEIFQRVAEQLEAALLYRADLRIACSCEDGCRRGTGWATQAHKSYDESHEEDDSV